MNMAKDEWKWHSQSQRAGKGPEGGARAPGGQSGGQKFDGLPPLHVGSSGHHFKHADRGPLQLLNQEQRQAQRAAQRRRARGNK